MPATNELNALGIYSHADTQLFISSLIIPYGTQICICIWLSISINQGELFASILMAACGGWGVYFSTTTQNIS